MFDIIGARCNHEVQTDVFRRSLRYSSRRRETWLKWKSYDRRREEM